MEKDYSIDDIYENNPFVIMLVFICGQIAINRRNSKFTMDEKRLLSLYVLFSSLMNCIESIRVSSILARSYTQSYLEANEIDEEKYMTYYYDMVVHKISTIRDLEFKIVHMIYGLPKYKGKYCWRTIKRNKNKINNENLFNYFNDKTRFNYVSYLIRKRQQSSHEGKLSLPQFKETTYYIGLRDLCKNPYYRKLHKDHFDYVNDPYITQKISQSSTDTLQFLSNLHQSAMNMCYWFLGCLSLDLSNLVTTEMKQTYQDAINRALKKIEKQNGI